MTPSRTFRYKIIYALVLIGFTAAFVWFLAPDFATGKLIVVVLVLLIPGRIQGWLWRERTPVASIGAARAVTDAFEVTASRGRTRP